jgi:UDPglucose--hexose-1-phosphate uridylyltransferase
MSATETKPVWEQRWHPLREEWVLYTSHRGGRPWVGDTHLSLIAEPPHYDPTCALCPGNPRLRGENPAYSGVHWFTNDLPCFSTEAPTPQRSDDLYLTRRATGTAEVVCYSPDHAKTFVDLTETEAGAVVDLWTERSIALGARPDIDHVLIFENKGSLVGTSNPHPHGQIYAGNLVYGITAREDAAARKFFAKTRRHLGQDIIAKEIAGPRLIAQNEGFIACVPWFARYAYEVLVLPRRQVTGLADLSGAERGDLGRMIREVAIRYDNLWQRPQPYVMAIHQAPTDGADHSSYPFHIEFHPPLRTPDTLKYLAGPEIGGGSMTNESSPDEKAAELRAVSPIHYQAAGPR